MNYTDKIKEKMNTLLQHSTPQESQQLYLQLCHFESYTNVHSVMSYFFSEYSIYYIQTSELYVYYKDNQYILMTENDILHLILKHLTLYTLNTTFKQQIKYKIHKKIKETSIYNTIPNSVTIQEVLSFLHPLLFTSKNAAKYFMTTLGDIIMKKTQLYYFLDPSMKPFIQTLQKWVSMYFCSNQLSHYKYKFYDHETSLCRILKTNPINFNYLKCDEPFYVNLICCSIHYSNRYSTGDLFLEDRTNQSLRQEVLWMKETKKEDIIRDFVHTYLQKSETHIHEKDVLFLWKLYIKEKNYINIFQKNIHQDLSQSILYQAPYFLNLTSMKMPYVKKFIHFWNKYMYEDMTEQLLELTEISSLFMEVNTKYTDMNEHHIRDILQYYFPEILIHENRYVNHIGCSLWNKKEELRQFIQDSGSRDYQTYAESTLKRKVSKQYYMESLPIFDRDKAFLF